MLHVSRLFHVRSSLPTEIFTYSPIDLVSKRPSNIFFSVILFTGLVVIRIRNEKAADNVLFLFSFY